MNSSVKLTVITFVTSESISAVSARRTVVSRVPWYSRVSTNAAFMLGLFLCYTPDCQQQKQERDSKPQLQHFT